MKKNIRLLFVPFLFSTFLFSCGGEDTSNDSASSSTSQQSGNSLTLNVFEAISLPNKFASLKGSVNDENIAKLSDGKIIGLSAGETTISFEGIAETITVKVSDSGDVPFLSVGIESLSLFLNESYRLTPTLTYKGKSVETSFAYSVNDPSVASVDAAGLLSSLKEGESEITVSASYYGLEADDYPFLATSFFLNVLSANSSLISTNTTSLSTFDCTIDGRQFVSEASISGIYSDSTGTSDLLKKDLTWVVSDPSVISISNGNVKALKKGTSEIYATYQGGESNHLTFTVDKPYYELETEGFYDSYNKTLSLDYSSVWQGGDSRAIAIYDDEEPSRNILKDDGSLDFDKLGKRRWTIEGDTYGYKVSTTSVSKIITSNSELTSMLLYGSNKKMSAYGYMSMEGYFVLGADIDMNGGSLRSILGPNNGANMLDSSGFIGTFDGQGHVIKNAKVTADNGGLFGTLAYDSVIKNVAFENIEIKGASGALTSYLGGSIENVYISGNITCSRGNSSSRSSLLANKIDEGSSVKNVIIEYKNASAKTPYASAIGYYDGEASESNFANTYVIGTESRVFSTAKSDSYVNFVNSKNGQYETYAAFKENANLSSFGENWSFSDDGINFHQ